MKVLFADTAVHLSSGEIKALFNTVGRLVEAVLAMQEFDGRPVPLVEQVLAGAQP